MIKPSYTCLNEARAGVIWAIINHSTNVSITHLNTSVVTVTLKLLFIQKVVEITLYLVLNFLYGDLNSDTYCIKVVV